MPRWFYQVTLAALQFLLAAPTIVSAQSLLDNPGFDLDLSGWAASPYQHLWTNQDAGGSPASGSVLMTVSSPSSVPWGTVGTNIGQCADVVPGQKYIAGMRIHIESGQTRSGLADILLVYSTTPGCSGPNLPGYEKIMGDGYDAWIPTYRTVTAPPLARSVFFVPGIQAFGQTGTFSARFDDAVLQPVDTRLRLAGDRFAVQVHWETRGGGRGSAQFLPLTRDSGAVWFFAPENLELIVKIVNGCPLNGRFWVFAGGPTDVGVTLTVTDTTTGLVKTYVNPVGRPFEPILDTDTFSTCP